MTWNVLLAAEMCGTSRPACSLVVEKPSIDSDVTAGCVEHHGRPTLQFVEKPSIDFSLSAVGLDVTLLPGVMPALRLLIRDTIVNKLMVFPRQLAVPILDDEVCPCENAFVRPLSIGGRGWTNERTHSLVPFVDRTNAFVVAKTVAHPRRRDSRFDFINNNKMLMCQLHRLVQFDNSTIRNVGVRSVDRCYERPRSI